MNVKFTLVFFAMATLLMQHSHCIPTHRNARGAPKGEIFNKIKEYMSQYQSGGSNAPTSSGATSSSSEGASGSSGSTYTQTETSAGSETAASEPELSVAAKDASSSSSSTSGNGIGNPFENYNSYIPAQYQNHIPSSFKPPQYSNFPNQFGQYMPSNSASSSSSSATPTEAASEQDFTVAAKEGSSPSSAPGSGFGNPFSNYNSYIPAQYQNQIPSSCMPNQFSQYIPSNSASSSSSSSTETGAASEQDFTVAAKEGSPPSSAPGSGFGNPFSNYNSYIPAQYQNQIPSSCMPNQFSQYIPSNSASSSSSSSTETGAASEQDFTVAAKEGSPPSSAPGSGFGNPFSNYNSYIPAQYQNQIPSSCMPNQFSQYIPSNSASSSSSSSAPTGAASEQDFTVAAKEGSSPSSVPGSGFGNPFSNYNSYIPAQYQNQIPSSCMPNQFSQYIPSNSGSSSSSSSTSAGSGAGAGAAASR